MQSDPAVAVRNLVLVGGGHSHLIALRDLARQRIPGIRLTLVCDDQQTTYSGMLPGCVAGHYRYDEMQIDLRSLAAFAGARFQCDEVIGIDRGRQTVLCRKQPPLPYDCLSINVGSTPALADVNGAAEFAIPVKPVRQFNRYWQSVCEDVVRSREPMSIAVVGAGVSGVELILAMHYRLQQDLQASGRRCDAVTFHLFSADRHLLSGHRSRVQETCAARLAARGIVVHRSSPIVRVAHGELHTRDGTTQQAQVIIWATQAGAAPWLRESGFAVDERGFVRVHDTLQTVSDPRVFAAGDCAAISGTRLAKAGVFAVRQGRPLAENLCRFLLGRPLRAWHPQRRCLALISTGDRYAIASRGGWSVEGGWVWCWKDWIDRRFMAGFSGLQPTNNEAVSRLL